MKIRLLVLLLLACGAGAPTEGELCPKADEVVTVPEALECVCNRASCNPGDCENGGCVWRALN